MDEIVSVNKILIIDDEQSTLKMLRLLLKTYGYSVFTAESGEKGLEVFREHEPSIVLTDVRMPGMGGIEVLKRLKRSDADVEVIVITGHGDMELAVQALQYDASDFINKPIQRETLEVALRRAKEKILLKKKLRGYTHDLETKVADATAELAKSYQRLETLYEMSRSVGETASLGETIELMREKISSLTGLKCHGFFVLNSRKDAILDSGDGGLSGRNVAAALINTIIGLHQPQLLDAQAKKQLLRLHPELQSENVYLLPIIREGELPIGASLVSLPSETAEGDLRLVMVLLSQAAGALRRAVLNEEELQSLRQLAKTRERFGELVGKHAKLQQVYKLVESIADSDATVLIQGESGTGKELVARRIHELSSRRAAPFVVINCAAFPETLLESEFFGHEKGAFTGAIHARKGAFELAHGGTIFLDEIGEVSVTAQVKLLRVLQFREFQRIGSETTIKVDVRVLAATSKDLRREMESGKFRDDLYYRLHVIPILMPPLRERMSDLPLLISHFLSKFGERYTKNVLRLQPDAMHILMNYHWPGNVRELENVIEHAFILAKNELIRAGDLPGYLKSSGASSSVGGEGLDELEKEHLIRILNDCKGNKIQAARRLKISRSTLYRKLDQYKIQG